MLGTKQTFEIEKGGQAKREPANPRLMICLLIIILSVLLCVLMSVIVVGVQLYMASNSEETTDMKVMARDMKSVMPQIKTFVPQITTAMDNVGSGDLNVTKLMHSLKDFEPILPKIKALSDLNVTKLITMLDELDSSGLSVTKLKDKLEDFDDMARDVKTIIPKVKALSDLNVTKLMDKLEGFEDMGRDMKSVMPQLKTFIPQITTLMDELESSDFNITKLMDKLKGFDGLSDKLKAFDALADMLQTNPLSLLLDGLFEANTDISRWRAVGLKAADILQKLAKVDYTVPMPKIRWDAIQHCDGEFDDGSFQGHDSAIYKTGDQNTCINFNLNAVGARGHGMCVWDAEKNADGTDSDKGECKNKDDDEKGYRWIRNVDSPPGDIIPKSFSDSLQNRFVQIHKFASDFGGDPSKVKELKSESTIDFPLWVTMFMGYVQPGMMENIIDATDFLDKQSIARVICEPGGGKENSNSCKWGEEGYVPSSDAGFRRILSIVRTMAQNVHKVWTM